MKTTFFALALCLFSFQIFADDSISPWICPSSIDGNTELISNEIEKSLNANNLEAAAQFAGVCASFGSGIDVMLLSPVLYAFDTALESTLSASEKSVLNSFIAKCNKKGEREGGSLGRSGAAHCQLKVYEGFYAAIKK